MSGEAAKKARERLRQAEEWERGFGEQSGLFSEAATTVALGVYREACGALSDDRAAIEPERLASMAAVLAGRAGRQLRAQPAAPADAGGAAGGARPQGAGGRPVTRRQGVRARH